MKKDLISECNDQRLAEQDFVATFCNRCKNKSCERAGWSSSSWESRISTQAERFLYKPNIVPQNESSRWGGIDDFEVVRQTSVAEVWGVPQRPTPPLFEAPEVISEPVVSEEEVSDVLSEPAVGVELVEVSAPEVVSEETSEPEKAIPQTRRLVNTPPQQIYVGGVEPPTKKVSPPTDPWAVPTNKVSVGGTFKMGG